jgi:hypothetical protein
MFQIILSEEIKAPGSVVWSVLMNTEDYPKWNTFVVACDSTFEKGAPINMRVRLLPFLTMSQKETVLENREGELLEYGISIPFGILSSSRQHKLTPIDSTTTRYESIFCLRGLFSPLVGLLLGSQLKRGFGDMTRGVVSRSIEVYQNEKRKL